MSVAHLLCDGEAYDRVSLRDVPCHNSRVCFHSFDGHIDRRRQAICKQRERQKLDLSPALRSKWGGSARWMWNESWKRWCVEAQTLPESVPVEVPKTQQALWCHRGQCSLRGQVSFLFFQQKFANFALTPLKSFFEDMKWRSLMFEDLFGVWLFCADQPLHLYLHRRKTLTDFVHLLMFI